MRNRTKILLLAMLTLVLTLLAVSTAGFWYYEPVVLTIATGPEASAEARFARRLADVLAQSHSSVRLVVEPQEGNAQALARFSRHEADLAMIRTDERKIPGDARALAVLEHEAMLVVGTRQTKLATLADLEHRKVVVVGRDGRNEGFLRRLLEQYKLDHRKVSIRTVAPETPIPALVGTPGTDLVVMFEPLSRLASAGEFEGFASNVKGLSVLAFEDAKALQRKIPGLYAETIEAGLLSGAPRIPDEDMDTVALHKILLAHKKLPESQAVDLMRALFENGSQLAVDKTFATRIEPPDTEKGALIAVHDGASQYVASDVKTFFERYSDLIYIGMSVVSILGSAAVALYSTVFRHSPRLASTWAAPLMLLRDRIRLNPDADLDLAEQELEAALNEVLAGLDLGAVSPRGIEAFRLAYDYAREALVEARRVQAPCAPSQTPDSKAI